MEVVEKLNECFEIQTRSIVDQGGYVDKFIGDAILGVFGAPVYMKNHTERALNAAKDPQLKMKLENMPIPLTADMIDEYMGPVLQAAKTGDLDLIVNV